MQHTQSNPLTVTVSPPRVLEDAKQRLPPQTSYATRDVVCPPEPLNCWAEERTYPSEIERAIFLRSLTEWNQFWVEIIIRSGIAATVRDALIEHRAVAEARR